MFFLELAGSSVRAQLENALEQLGVLLALTVDDGTELYAHEALAAL